jgi:hypothetical protein
LLDPATCEIPDSPSAFRSYRSETAILRVSKSVHDLAKGHLHYSLSWIRFDINWDALPINPSSIGVPYIDINRADTPYSGDLRRRSYNQQAPPGRLVVRVKFPPPKSLAQMAIKVPCFNSPFAAFTSLPVLERDLAQFLRVFRMSDMAYCEHMLPTAQTSKKVLTTRSDDGLSIKILIPSGLALKKYKHLLEKFRLFYGPFHHLTITGHEDPTHAAFIAAKVELRVPQSDRRAQVMGSSARSSMKIVKDIMGLKSRGDKHL